MTPLDKYGIDLLAFLSPSDRVRVLEADLGDGERLPNATIAAAVRLAAPLTRDEITRSLNRVRRKRVDALLAERADPSAADELAVADLIRLLQRLLARGEVTLSADLGDPETLADPGNADLFRVLGQQPWPGLVRDPDQPATKADRAARARAALAEEADGADQPPPRLAKDPTPDHVLAYWRPVLERNWRHPGCLDSVIDTAADDFTLDLVTWALDEIGDRELIARATVLRDRRLAALDQRLALMATAVRPIVERRDLAWLGESMVLDRQDAALAAELIELCDIARQRGPLAIEERCFNHPEPFLRWALGPYVDGYGSPLLPMLLDGRRRALLHQRRAAMEMTLVFVLGVRNRDNPDFATIAATAVLPASPDPYAADEGTG